jgi:hypothetical protein
MNNTNINVGDIIASNYYKGVFKVVGLTKRKIKVHRIYWDMILATDDDDIYYVKYKEDKLGAIRHIDKDKVYHLFDLNQIFKMNMSSGKWSEAKLWESKLSPVERKRLLNPLKKELEQCLRDFEPSNIDIMEGRIKELERVVALLDI